MTAPLGAGWDRDRCNEWFRYHSEISYALTMQRTALESALIPVTAYIVVACVECYRRYPEMVQQIADAVPPEELGRAGHELATQIDPVQLWAVPNFTLLGRTVLAGAGLLDAEQEVGQHRAGLRLLGARRACLPLRRRDASGVGCRRRRDPVPRPRRGHREGMPAVARRRRARADGAPQRARHVVPVLAVVRHALGLPGHRSVPPRRRADVAAPVVQPSRRLALPVEREVSTELPYSDVLAAFVLDDASTSVSPTSARR